LCSAGVYREFGTERGVPAAFLRIAWHDIAPRNQSISIRCSKSTVKIAGAGNCSHFACDDSPRAMLATALQQKLLVRHRRQAIRLVRRGHGRLSSQKRSVRREVSRFAQGGVGFEIAEAWTSSVSTKVRALRPNRVDRLVERYGLDAKINQWSDEVSADCPRKQAMNLNDMCGARCPDLPNVA
jgi:hypothetical protein